MKFHRSFVLLSIAYSAVGSSYDPNANAPPSWYSPEENQNSSGNLPPPPPPPNFPDESGSYGRPPPYSSQQDPRAFETNDAPLTADRDGYSNSQSTFQEGGMENNYYNDNNPRPSSENTDTKAPTIPIHYDFPASADNEDEENDDAESPKFASARRDLVTKYMSTTSGKLQVFASSAVVGGSGGVFLAKSVIPIGTSALGTVGASSFLIGTAFRTPFGELTRALGLSLILVLQRTSKIRKTYPTWRYVAAFFGISSRNLRPFPPARNPWRYTPRRADDVDFSMLYSIIAMAFVGSFCGGNMPVIPTWMGSLAGAGLFALGCTLSSSRGDLCRTMGMRVVALLQELWDIQAELKIIPKAAVVSSQVIDKLMIFDRKHKVKDRFLSLATSGYDQVMQSASKMQQDRQGKRDTDSDDRERRRPSRDRPYGPDERKDNSRDRPYRPDQRKDDRENEGRQESFRPRERDDQSNGNDRDRRDFRAREGDRDEFRDEYTRKTRERDEKPKRGRFWRK